MARRKLTLLLIPIVALTAAGIFADWFAAAIITDHPLLQMILNPRLRYLTLASNQVDPVPFFLVGFFRLVLTDPLYYLLGRWYGDAALRWMERHGGESGAAVRIFERWFAKAAYPMVAIAPNGFICLLAGTTGMRPAVFAALNVTGTIVRLIVVRASAEALEGPLDAVLDFIREYQWWVVGVSVALGLFQWWRSRRAGRDKLKSPGRIEEELEEAEAEVQEEASTGSAGRGADG
ncbi:MAG: VTT domain-containing protein [Actinomycetota bacterium]|nr:VTT domain-containing protein [Actinomycetota bacterium]